MYELRQKKKLLHALRCDRDSRTPLTFDVSLTETTNLIIRVTETVSRCRRYPRLRIRGHKMHLTNSRFCADHGTIETFLVCYQSVYISIP